MHCDVNPNNCIIYSKLRTVRIAVLGGTYILNSEENSTMYVHFGPVIFI